MLDSIRVVSGKIIRGNEIFQLPQYLTVAEARTIASKQYRIASSQEPLIRLVSQVYYDLKVTPVAIMHKSSKPNKVKSLQPFSGKTIQLYGTHCNVPDYRVVQDPCRQFEQKRLYVYKNSHPWSTKNTTAIPDILATRIGKDDLLQWEDSLEIPKSSVLGVNVEGYIVQYVLKYAEFNREFLPNVMVNLCDGAVFEYRAKYTDVLKYKTVWFWSIATALATAWTQDPADRLRDLARSMYNGKLDRLVEQIGLVKDALVDQPQSLYAFAVVFGLAFNFLPQIYHRRQTYKGRQYELKSKVALSTDLGCKIQDVASHLVRSKKIEGTLKVQTKPATAYQPQYQHKKVPYPPKQPQQNVARPVVQSVLVKPVVSRLVEVPVHTDIDGYYKTFGFSAGLFSIKEETLRESYLQLVKTWHPDMLQAQSKSFQIKAAKQFRKLALAKEILLDDKVKREAYDKKCTVMKVQASR